MHSVVPAGGRVCGGICHFYVLPSPTQLDDKILVCENVSDVAVDVVTKYCRPISRERKFIYFHLGFGDSELILKE